MTKNQIYNNYNCNENTAFTLELREIRKNFQLINVLFAIHVQCESIIISVQPLNIFIRDIKNFT